MAIFTTKLVILKVQQTNISVIIWQHIALFILFTQYLNYTNLLFLVVRLQDIHYICATNYVLLQCKENEKQLQTAFIYCANNRQSLTSSGALAYLFIKSVTHYM